MTMSSLPVPPGREGSMAAARSETRSRVVRDAGQALTVSPSGKLAAVATDEHAAADLLNEHPDRQEMRRPQPQPRYAPEVAVTRCPECGAPARPHSCEDLFGAVLALDHSRREPWGPLHSVTVSCYLLQHPSRLPEAARARPWAVLHTYLDGGLPAVTRLAEGARRANSHCGRGVQPSEAFPGSPPPPLTTPPTAFSVTVNDVAHDGTFPADGFPERVTAWAEAVISAWNAPTTATGARPNRHPTRSDAE